MNKKKRELANKTVLRTINDIISGYTQKIYEYNNIVRKKGYYLKPVHIVVKKRKDGTRVKYYYYGRYWYRIEIRKNGSSQIKWIYLGKEKPDKDLPDPPKNPLEGLVVRVDNEGISLNKSLHEILRLVKELAEKEE